MYKYSQTTGFKHPMIPFLLFVIYQIHIVSAQLPTRTFPNLFNAAEQKPITTQPSQATCGIPVRTAHCKSSTVPQADCMLGFCDQTCTRRTALPGDYVDLLLATGIGTGQASDCVSLDSVVLRPGSTGQSVRFEKSSRTDCYLTPIQSDKIIFGANGAFTLSLWVRRIDDSNADQTLFEKGFVGGSVIFSVQIVNSRVFVRYGSTSVQMQETVPASEWIHLAIQVYDKTLSVFKNGGGLAFASSETESLTTQIQGATSAVTRIGQSLNGTGQFVGHLQEFRFYGVTLTNREIVELYSGTFPTVYIQSDCRCPETHPRVKQNQDRYCIRNGVPDNTGDEVVRLNEYAHPLQYLNDGDSNSVWISQLGSMDITIEIDLGDDFQVFYVVMQFYSPLPKIMTIKRWKSGSNQWQPWQYYAENCLDTFSLPNGGALTNADSVNCLQLGNNVTTPYSKGNVTFVLLSSEPVARPGYNDFYGTPALYEFVQASKVQIRLQQRFHLQFPRDYYYGLYDLIITARCDCNGHAETCNTNVPYRCNCNSDSFTTGKRCDTCLPLYNDKPFRVGDQINAFNCRPCTCNNHADSCVYNASLDPFPSEHARGGGGICVNCSHNTQGRYCDECVAEYYRPKTKQISDVDACSPCNCNTDGTVNGNKECQEVNGQCQCKSNVTGRTCSQCVDGFFQLQGSNPSGCQACGCNVAGTVGGSVTCDAFSGNCECKLNVIVGKCTQCKFGFYNLDIANPQGCTECACNAKGSTSAICNRDDGSCACIPNVIGQHCDECADDFYDFDKKCLSCDCNPEGTLPGYPCNKTTGQCVCKRNVGGDKCDVCLDGFYNFGGSTQDGCLSCGCDVRGTVNGSSNCNKTTGQCTCKMSLDPKRPVRVEGKACDQCSSNSWNLSASNPIGCQLCNCSLGGITDTQSPKVYTKCNSNTGQCACLPYRIGRDCSRCMDGYKRVYIQGGGCTQCQCSSAGTRPNSFCDESTGNCVCKDGISGANCDKCVAGFYGYNVFTGTCEQCSCNQAGSRNDTCEQQNGRCYCKDNVKGTSCDQCKVGSSNLDANNPLGCSRAPAQQSQPSKTDANATSLIISWQPPDQPNGVLRQYKLYRDSRVIATISASENLTHTDTGLQPFTSYEYKVESFNDVGSAMSQPVIFVTLAGPPEGSLTLVVQNVADTSADFSWNTPSKINGPSVEYIIESVTPSKPNSPTVHWQGTQLNVRLTDLTPFTNYTFYVKACNKGGCLTSDPVYKTTQQGSPQGQPAPRVVGMSATSLYVEWDHPSEPNGIIIAYELWMRSNGVAAKRVFINFGQYNPRPTSAPLENALPEPQRNFTVHDLKPYTEYEFQVFSQNEISKAASQWTAGRTKEASPLSTPPPVIVGLSSSSLRVTWVHPSPEVGRGLIVRFKVFQIKKTNLTLKPFDPPMYNDAINVTDGSGREVVVSGLPAYSAHTFFIEACNSIGCVNSTVATGRTLAAAPKNQMPPSVTGYNSTVMLVSWTHPAQINGPWPTFKVEKTATAFNNPPPRVIRGTRFPGGGYHLFPPDTIPQVVGFTGIDLWFKTSQFSGLILFAASEGRQEEFIAIQLRYGRPWFLFDPQGCSSFIEPDPAQDGNRTYNDNQWHHIVVTRDGSSGQIIVDDVFRGCSTLVTPTNDEGLPYNDNKWHHLRAIRYLDQGIIQMDSMWSGTKSGLCTTGNVIGKNTGVYLGGLPPDYTIKRTGNDPREKILRQSFQGCLRDVKVMTQKTPVPIWTDIDWTKAVKIADSFPNWEGCPVSLDNGAHFLGRGYIQVDKSSFTGGSTFTVVMQMRTEIQSGLLFFMFGNRGVLTYAQLAGGALLWHLEMRINGTTFRKALVYSSTSLCNGQWRSITFKKTGQELTITVDGTSQNIGDSSLAADIYLDSDLYLGGLNSTAMKVAQVLDDNPSLRTSLMDGFAGCLKNIMINGVPLDLVSSHQSLLNVNLDGCPPVATSTSTCQTGGFKEIYSGPANQTYDHGLAPFTEYFYRVTASNSEGSTMSDWAKGRTREGAPTGVSPPYGVKTYTGYVIEAKWREPTGNTGLITEYKLRAHNLDNPNQKPAEASFKESVSLHGNITTAIPFSNYTVKLVACTMGGCTESSSGVPIRTREEAPDQVQPVRVVSKGAYWIHVQWSRPVYPNGIITGYLLYQDGRQVHTGGQLSTNVTNLQVYTSYVFRLEACTKVGCKASPPVTETTAQLPPTSVDSPTLTVFDKSSIHVKWTTPSQLNGKLERYQLYVSRNPTTNGERVHDSADLFLYKTLVNLTAGTTYYIRVAACTGGGCRLSNPRSATTEESSPEGVRPPNVTSPSPSKLVVEWKVPDLPNGVITSYTLYHNGLAVYTHQTVRQYEISGLLPYSKHLFYVKACTRKGCGRSEEIIAFTQEAAPSGAIVFELSVNGSRSVLARWTNVPIPNGVITYTVFFTGLFYVDPVNWNYNTVRERRPLLSAKYYGVKVYIDGLLPHSQYEVQVNASNSKGYLLSDVKTANMPMGGPDGVKPPVLSSPDSNSIQATWQPVGRYNADVQPVFQLQLRGPNGIVQDLFNRPTTSTAHLTENLTPYTKYEFRLVASNSYGQTPTEWVSIYTKQDVPGRPDPPMTTNVRSRQIDVTWTPPLPLNGIITIYRIYTNNAYKESVPGNVTSHTVGSLTPYTFYVFAIEACTIAGCTRSGASSQQRTLPAEPEEIPKPVLVSETPTSVLIQWGVPAKPNGILIGYSIQRRKKGESAVSDLQSFNMNEGRSFVDETAQLKPYMTYEYRITARTSSGVGYGPWAEITTKSSRPSPMSPPVVRNLSPTSVVVEWRPPVSANGQLERYVVRMPEPRVEVRNTSVRSVQVDDLVPYTQYSVTITACTDGGCTESTPTVITTAAARPQGLNPPTTTPVSRTVIQVNWERPQRPNGPNLEYELSRKKLRQPLDSSASGFNFWQNVYVGTNTYFEDRGLTMFTTYVYRVSAINDEGSLVSGTSAEVSTFGGVPRSPAVVTARAVSHVAIRVSWTTPSVVDLQGQVEVYRVLIKAGSTTQTREFKAPVNSSLISGLQPNTLYEVTVTIVINGGASIASQPVYATTLDGAPEGLAPPQLFVISNNALRVVWTMPSQPNGAITGFYIYVDGRKVDPNMVTAGSYVLGGLQPYTIYSVQVEVCTQFACLKSNTTKGTTAESVPDQLSRPNLRTLGPYSIDVTWTQPAQPNGIILRYDIIRQTVKDCSDVIKPTIIPDADKCTYVECGKLEGLCGSQCFSGSKTCCDGVLHDNKPGHECCGRQYVTRQSSTQVCCGERFLEKKTNFKCCGGKYVQVLPDQVCCPDAKEDRVDVGTGDKCCGSIPYLSSGSQICCNSKLHARFNKQCCGGEVTDSTRKCCGGALQGVSYISNSVNSCCGTEYVNNASSTCCSSETGKTKVHSYSSASEKANANEVCCGIELMSSGLQCCNSVPFNPVIQVCADTSSQVVKGCGKGMTCSVSQASSAKCDRCDFDSNSQVCHTYTGSPTSATEAPPTDNGRKCRTGPVKIFSGLVFTYTDENLEPWTTYEYAVIAVNKAGRRMSDYAAINTSQALPRDLQPPVAKTVDNRVDVIMLQWKPPLKPNGEILHYVLYRENFEIYRGLSLTYSDSNNVKPYKTYSYKIQACNIEGCIESSVIVVATVEAVPESLSPPTVIAVNSSALQLKWNPPTQPNGIIVKYTLYSEVARIVDLSAVKLAYMYSGLSPFTEYNFILSACTGAGCRNSSMVTGVTLESPPDGMAPPKAIIVSSSIVELFWEVPASPNGIIVSYKLYRDTVQVFSGTNSTTTYRDSGLAPGRQYTYKVQAANRAGARTSGEMSVLMPTLTPIGIPAPNVTALSARSIHVSWSAPTTTNGVIDQYKILQDGGTSTAVVYTGVTSPRTVDNLNPYTKYSIRIQACLKGFTNGCGTGPPSFVTTLEAPPVGLSAPTLKALGPTVILVQWEKPSQPNGVLTKFELHQRNVGSQLKFIVTQLPGTEYSYRIAGSSLRPFTEYEYQLTVFNSVGSVKSPWASVRTLEAPPQGMSTPTVVGDSAYGLRVTWQMPTTPNGVITLFKIEYQQVLNDPTLTAPINGITVNGNVLSTSFSGLTPFTSYKVRVSAVNSAGQTTSPFSEAKTKEAAPADIKKFTVEKRVNGESVVLRWAAPGKPNGVITTYRIFDENSVKVHEGSNREFEYPRLTPYTQYSVLLEACTQAGCGRSALQTFTTAEIAPKNQPVPVFGSSNATHIVIRWTPPINPNGKIVLYEIYRKDVGPVVKRQSEGNVVYSTTNTDASQYSYTNGGLRPYYKYEYKIRSHNSISYIDSSWMEKATNEAAPQGVLPPTVEFYSGQPDKLRITWSPPAIANGEIQNYQLQRNQSTPLSFLPTATREYIDSGLLAYTVYSYTIRVCTRADCTTSAPTYKRTQETAPHYVNPPQVNAVNSTAIRAVWTVPQITNGKVSQYQLKVDGSVKYAGMALEFTVGSLIPYKEYRFVVSACTNGGCTDSNSVIARPTESAPKGMRPPILRVISSKTIEVTWKKPDSPNGIIQSYELRRDNVLLYEGVNTNYIDYNLEPGVLYGYRVKATNSKGSVTSTVNTARTYSSSPEGLAPPVLQAVSSTEIKATWSKPAKPNGVVRNYTLLQDDNEVFIGLAFENRVAGLSFYTEYDFRIKACTDGGCLTSAVARQRTLPAKPIGMNKPVLLPQADSQGAHAGVLVEWSLPIQPNGEIVAYRVYRRKITQIAGSTAPVYGREFTIYNGTSLRYMDADLQALQPFAQYQYRVAAINTIGMVKSDWQVTTTLQAPPSGMLAPVVEPSANTIKVTVKPPAVPNGYINTYNIIVNGTLVKSSQSLVQTVGDNIALQAFTWYAVQAEACTAGGCTRSPETLVKTLEDVPVGLAPVVVASVNATSALLRWSPPQYPNGILRRYEVLMRTACPSTEQPVKAQTPCLVGSSTKTYNGLGTQYVVQKLLPYTAYEFQLSVHNDVGGVNQPGWTAAATTSAAPQYLRPPTLKRNGTFVDVTWTQTFRLNGKLKEYRLYSNGNKVYNGFDTASSIERATKEQVYTFYVTVTTGQGTARSPDVVFDPTGSDNVPTTPKSGTSSAQVLPIYQEVWFIAVVTVAALLLLFAGIALCLHSSGTKAPYIRERLPLPARPRKDESPLYCVDPYDGSIITTDIARAPSHASLHQIQTGFVNPAYSHSSLPRSLPRSRASSVIDLSEKMSKSSKYLEEEDDVAWDSFMPEEEQYEDDNISQKSGRSGRPYSVLKEQTMFTDTHL